MKAQSAMEYLMTYGWSILIIAVVIASLIELGVFNSVNSSPSSCIGVTGYSCSNPILYASGALVTKLGQVSTGTITITGTACTKNSTVTAITPVTSTQLQSEQQSQIIFHCPIASNVTGTQFTGHLWIEYSTSSQQNIIQEVGVVQTPVVSANVTAYAPVAYITTSTNVIGINLATNKIIYNTEIPIPGVSLAGIAISGTTAYIANSGNCYSTFGNVIAFSLSTNMVVATYNSPLFSCPINIAISGSMAYVTNGADPGNIIQINTYNGKVTAIDSEAIALSSPRGIAVSGTTAYVIDAGESVFPVTTGNMVEISTVTDAVTGSIPTSGSGAFYYPYGIAISGTKAYVVNSNAGNILIVDLAGSQVTGSITSPTFYDISNIAISGTTAYVVNGNQGVYGEGNVIEVNLNTGDVVGAIDSPQISYPFGIAIYTPTTP